MTRTELVEVVYRRHGGISRREAHDLLDLILHLIKDRLAAGERVEIPGFGAFEVTRTPDRVVRHPVTGRTLRLGGRKGLAFRPSRLLKQHLNPPPSPEDRDREAGQVRNEGRDRKEG